VDDEQRVMRDQVDDATQRMLKTASTLSDEEVRQPSLLPGWTRGHVLAHLAGNADALRNLLIWARTGVKAPAYASQQARDEAIEAGAGRTAAELLADITRTAEAFRAEAATLDAGAWEVPVHLLDGQEFPAALVLTRRLVEVELHHTDLGSGYRQADWPAAFAEMDLPEPMRSQRADRR
jgi:maleylpyruvate isomerase